MKPRAVDGSSTLNRAVARLLIDVCRSQVVTVPTSPGAAEAIVGAARHHRIAPLAHVSLRDAAPALAALLAADRDAAKALHIQASMLLAEVGHLLGEMPWIAFKGPVLSERAHPVPGLRRYGDVDLLVAPENLRETARRLRTAGWRLGDYGDMLRNPQTPGQMHWFTPAGIQVDLHWTMINMASRRRLFNIPTSMLLERRVPARIGLGTAWTMDAVDTIVHVCLHAALAGANRLIWLLDVDQLARRTAAWDEVAHRARAWGVEAQVALVLRRAATALGTPVPESVYRQLGTSTGLRALLDVVDRLSPVARHRQEASIARLVARAVRPGMLATLVVVGRHAARGAAERLGPSRGAEPAAQRARADAHEVEEYLTAVERQVSATERAAPRRG